ncbi:MAG: hypothetical protein V2B14_01120 [bacterium]
MLITPYSNFSKVNKAILDKLTKEKILFEAKEETEEDEIEDMPLDDGMLAPSLEEEIATKEKIRSLTKQYGLGNVKKVFF